jgi:hypothetical protein
MEGRAVAPLSATAARATRSGERCCAERHTALDLRRCARCDARSKRVSGSKFTVEDKRDRRLAGNREAAQKSRAKKKQQAAV